MTNENSLMVLDNFKLPAAQNTAVEEPIDDLNDFEGIMMSFPRIKIPGGGSTQFEVPSENPQKPDYLPSIEGIIIYNHNTNAYWEEGAEFDMNASPMCSSPDGKTGYGDPGGACATCPYNQYDTDPNGGRGKACKNMRSLYILQHDKLMPINLLLPPTSLKEYSNFVQNAFIMRKRPLWGSLVHIELRKVANGSNNYAVAVFTRVGDFTGEKLAEIKEYAIGARAAIKEMLEQRAINTENRNEPLDAITEVIDETDEGGEPFNAANAIGDGSITA